MIGTQEKRLPYLLLIPSIVVMGIVLVYPFFSTIALSFKDFKNQQDFVFTFKNYATLFGDPEFWHSLSNTFVYLFFSVAAHLLIGLGVAMLLNQIRKYQGFARTLFMLPWTIPPVIVAVTWAWMYNPTSGIINDILLKSGTLREPILWLSDKSLAMFSIVFANIWRGFPYVMLVLLAGLQSISREQYQAASIDGAGPWKQFFYITLPNLRKNIIVAVALDIVQEARKIDLVKVMTGGGPGTLTDIMVSTIYKQYFAFFQFEYASAMGVLFCIFLLIVSLQYVNGLLKET